MGKITEKNKEFVQEYLLTGNATKSYMKIYKNENEKMPNRLRASEMLTKSLGGFEDKQLININGAVIFKGEDNIED